MFGLYIHLPFCVSKCHYCDFPSLAGQDDLINRYSRALLLEAANSRAIGRWVDTVYWGGGSPSHISRAVFEYIWQNLVHLFYFQSETERTIEVNPAEISAEKLLFWKNELLINRISIGLQIADDEILQKIGRRYSWLDFVSTYKMVQKYFDNINVDIIYGLPETTESIWTRTLKKIVDLKPTHISAYPLEVAPETLLGQTGFRPDENQQATFYQMTVDFLVASGYRHYEISNFALPGYECQHNLNYWRQGNYLGLGLGAASFLGNLRWKNVPDLDKYLSSIEKDDFSGIIAEREILSLDQLFRERIILGLRLDNGVRLSHSEWVKLKDGLKESRKYRLIDLNFSEPDNIQFRLTARGKFLSNIVFQEIV